MLPIHLFFFGFFFGFFSTPSFSSTPRICELQATERTEVTLLAIEKSLESDESIVAFDGHNALLSGPERIFVTTHTMADGAIVGGRSFLFKLGSTAPFAAFQAPNNDFGSSGTGIASVSANQEWIATPSGAVLSGFGWFLTQATGERSRVRRFDEVFELDDYVRGSMYEALPTESKASIAKEMGFPMPQAVGRIQFSPDGQNVLISGDHISVIRNASKWDIENKIIHPLHSGHSFFLGGGAYVARLGNELGSGYKNRTLNLFDTVTGDQLWTGPAGFDVSSIFSYQFESSPDSNYFLIHLGVGFGSRVYTLGQDQIPQSFVLGVATFSAKHIFEFKDGTLLRRVSLSASPEVLFRLPNNQLVDRNTRTIIKVNTAGTKAVIQFAPSQLLLWSENQIPKVQDVALPNHALMDIALSPSGNTVLLIYAKLSSDRVVGTTSRLYHFGP